MLRVAINGFGRIGRNFLRAVLQDSHATKNIQIVAINIGPARKDMLAHMFMYDTLLGAYPGKVEVRDGNLIIDERSIQLFACTDLAQIKWDALHIDWVVDASGHYTDADTAREHLKVGAKNVLITAPAHGDDVTIIPGVNDALFNPKKDHIVSLGSCTTNAFMPMLKILDEAFSIQSGMMTTIHAYTNSQVLLDVEAKDPRIARAAALNIIPTGTGASKMIAKVLPHLAESITASSIRVPVAKVSLIDLVISVTKKVNEEKVNEVFKQASLQHYKAIVAYTDLPLVSSDYSGNSASVIIDSLLTHVQNDLVQVFGWYDNEWGYSERLKDFLLARARS